MSPASTHFLATCKQVGSCWTRCRFHHEQHKKSCRWVYARKWFDFSFATEKETNASWNVDTCKHKILWLGSRNGKTQFKLNFRVSSCWNDTLLVLWMLRWRSTTVNCFVAIVQPSYASLITSDKKQWNVQECTLRHLTRMIRANISHNINGMQFIQQCLHILRQRLPKFGSISRFSRHPSMTVQVVSNL